MNGLEVIETACNWTQVIELAGEEQYPAAARLLEEISPERLGEEDFCRLEECLAALPEAVRRKTGPLCYLSLRAELRRGRVRQARQWLGHLALLRDACAEGTRERAAAARYVWLSSLLMPQNDNGQLLLLLSILHNETMRYRLPPAPLPVTGGRPSVLRGDKDLSEWGKNYRAVASIVEPLLASVTPGDERRVAAAALAELLYEHNDITAASMEVAAALNAESIDIAFAGYGQLARIARLDGASSKRPEELLQSLGRLLDERGAAWLTPNYRALCARFDIHAGRLDAVREWLEQSTVTGFGDCCAANAYELITRSEALIALGRSREALTLLESLLLLLREDFRPLDTAECLVHSAVACELLGSRELALGKLEEALLLAGSYHYVRVIADGGRVVFHLLAQLAKTGVAGVSPRYLEAVAQAARTYSTLAPRLYSQEDAQDGAPDTPELTGAELQILHLVEAGRTNAQIAEELGVKPGTVKFHITNILERLGASNRVEAVKAARQHSIL